MSRGRNRRPKASRKAERRIASTSSPSAFPQSAWHKSRSGSHAGRGFHFQDRVAAHVAVLMWNGSLAITAVVPEGLEDISLETKPSPIHVQVKSRRPEQPPHTEGQLVDHLSTLWKKHRDRLRTDPDARVVLVLERYVEGWRATGWLAALADDEAAVQALRPLLIQKGFADDLDQLFASTSIVVPGNMDARDLDAVATGLGIGVPAVCWSHLHELRVRLGSMADENGVRSAADRARMGIPDVQRLLEGITARVDVESLTVALSAGICQHIEFDSPIEDSTFYEGVDVVPGHIGAGLVLERPDLVADVVAGLDRQRSVLIIGPSGAGKSALAWLSAYHTRDDVLWYRTSRLREEDVPLILRLVDARLPRSLRRVGLVVDGLGRPETAGWDRLVRDTAHRPGVCLIGTVRHEDLIVIASAPMSYPVRPRLDEKLAGRIYERLVERKATSWADWREPFIASKGLLLEYSHILTAGDRLDTTIRSQVAARLRDAERDHETSMLRLVATAHAWGVSIPVRRLQTSLGLTDEQTRRALVRLVEEHLIRITNDRAEGLHELRSRALVAASHDPPPPMIPDTIGLVADLLDADHLQTFVTRVLDERAVSDEVIIERCAATIAAQPGVASLTAVARALRVVGSGRIARQWAQILREARVPEPAWEIAALQAVGNSTVLDWMLGSIRASVPRMRTVLAQHAVDLRGDLLERLAPETLATIWESVSALDEAAQLLEAFRGYHASRLTDAVNARLNTLLSKASPQELARLLSAGSGVSLDFASDIVARVGGDRAIERLLLANIPWLEALGVVRSDGGLVAVEGEVLFVSPVHLPDPHAYVVDLCSLVLACFPAAEEAAIRAIDPAGESAGYGSFTLAEKHIPRSNLPPAGQIALNRERITALITVASPVSRTERLTKERDVLRRVADVLRWGMDEWLRGRPLSPTLISAVQDLEKSSDLLPIPDRGTLVVEEAEGPGTSTWGFARAITANLLPRLFDPTVPPQSLVGYVGDTLSSMVEKLSQSEAWEPLSSSPVDVAHSILRDLSDFHAVLAEIAEGGEDVRTEITRIARQTKGSGLKLCAVQARRRAEARVNRQIGQLVRGIRELGHEATVARRAVKSETDARWPAIEIAVLVPLDTVGPTWQIVAQGVAEVARRVLGPVLSIIVAPTRDEKVVASQGLRVIGDLFPAPDDLKRWGSDLPQPLLDENRRGEFATFVSAAVELSALLRLESKGREPLEAEQQAARDAEARMTSAAPALGESMTALEPELAREMVDFTRELQEELQKEATTVSSGGRVTNSIAAQFTSAVARSVPSHLVGMFTFLSWALIEQAVRPDGAVDRVLQDVAAHRGQMEVAGHTYGAGA